MTTLSSIKIDSISRLAYRALQPVPANPSGLLILLHGVGGIETNLEFLASGMPAEIIVLFVRAPLTLAPGQNAWFRVTFTDTGPRIEVKEAEDSRLSLINFVKSIQQDYHISPAKTVIAGFSQGGILSASVALSSPELLAGFAVLCGRVLPELEPVITDHEALAHLRAFVAHGLGDDRLPIYWAKRTHALLENLGVMHQMQLYSGGHAIGQDMANDFKAFVADVLAGPEVEHVA